MSDDEICGAEKNNGDLCEYAPKYDDGRCGIHSDHNERTPAGGRPSEFEEYRDDMLAGARQGMTLAGIARLAGVAEKTLHNWINKNEEFRKSLKRARAQGELRALQTKNEKGSQFLLERSYGYTKTERHEVESESTVEHSGEVDHQMGVSISHALVTEDDDGNAVVEDQ